MRKRLTIGLATGLLAAAMLPGVTAAAPGNLVLNFGQCEHPNGANGTAGPSVTNKNGSHVAQGDKGNGRWVGWNACTPKS